MCLLRGKSFMFKYFDSFNNFFLCNNSNSNKKDIFLSTNPFFMEQNSNENDFAIDCDKGKFTQAFYHHNISENEFIFCRSYSLTLCILYIRKLLYSTVFILVNPHLSHSFPCILLPMSLDFVCLFFLRLN